MTSGSASSGGRALDALSGRPKTAIVTGGSSGIGLEMVKRLIEKGYRVVANSRNITSAMTLHGTADLKLVDGDIGIEETAKHVVRSAIQNFGTVDLLVKQRRRGTCWQVVMQGNPGGPPMPIDFTLNDN